MSLRITVLATIAVALLGVGTAGAVAPYLPPPVEVTGGSVFGTIHIEDDYGVQSYRGIPFAQPPVGSLRWRPPQPVKALGDFAGLHNGPACPQHIPPVWGPDPRQSEDCLYLNIWEPIDAKPSAHLPVMVWIYGGGFVIGDSASKIYNGSNLARSGVVVVNFNYRLGRLGWFAHPELTREGGDAGTGDFGLMDQIAALKWVRDNITAFGGDPANVTIFGESAGAMSVNLLMVAPSARGLFAKAITESGLGRIAAKPLAAAEAQGIAFAKSAGAEDLDALRKLPVATILAGGAASVESGENPGPILDGKLIPENIDRAFAEGKQAPVPWMVGSNDYEASLFPGMLSDPDKVMTNVPAAARPLMSALFDPDKTGDRRTVAAGMLTDSVFTEPARFLASQHAKLGQPVYRYFFAYVPETQRATLPGAGHGSEIQFVFGTLGTYYAAKGGYSDFDRRVSADMGRYWTNFAKTGNPNSPEAGGVEWPRDTGDQALVIDKNGEHAAPSLRKARLDIMAARAKP